jgi:hypothetical protein
MLAPTSVTADVKCNNLASHRQKNARHPWRAKKRKKSNMNTKKICI